MNADKTARFVKHRKIFCPSCMEETSWYIEPAFDKQKNLQPTLVASCIECGAVRDARDLSVLDTQTRYLHRNETQKEDK